MRGKFLYFLVCLFLGFPIISFSQVTAAGDIAFTALNVDGDDDFAFVALVDISVNTTVYFTDKTWDNTNSIFVDSGSDGFLSWNSGASVIKAGTVVVFTDTDNSTNPRYGASVGTLSSPENVILVASGETLFAYLGTDQNTPTTFLAGIKNKVLTAGELNGTALTAGINFLEFNPTLSPDGGYYSGSRSSQTAYTNYLTLLNSKANWAHNTSNGEATLPISTSGFTIASTNWTGTTDTDWNTSGNWDNGIPDNSFKVVIPNVTNKPIINNTAILIGDLTIDASSALTINAGKELTISGNLVNNGTFTINSDTSNSGSLIVTGTATGNVTYNRYMTGVDKWHLIAAPVSAQSINTFVTTGSNNIDVNGVNYSLTPYDNTFSKGNASVWTHWTSDGTAAGNVSGAGNFLAGKGYEILRTTNGTVAFTGTILTSQVSIAISSPVSNNAWNLIGNPFPSAIFANSNADATNNFISLNAASLDASYQAIYLWNPVSSSYDLINQSTATTYIAPGQGFFVKSVSAGATVNFTTVMRTNQSGVAFQKTTVLRPNISLKADNGTTIKTTEIKYINGKSLGLDPGYDAGLFDATGGSFNIYTKLVEDNGVNFMLQVLPDSLYDTTIVPIGLDADAGSEISFKADATDLPSGKKVYLEDRMLNSFNEINNTDKFYNVTLSTQSQGVGRFYLRTLDNLSTLAIQDFNTLGISLIAHPKENSIRIIGNIKSITRLAIYDMLGRLIYTTVVRENNNNEVRIRDMAKGVYIVKIQTEKGNYNTKIAWY